MSNLPTALTGRDPIFESFMAPADSIELELGLTLWVNGISCHGHADRTKKRYDLADQVSNGSGVLAQNLGTTLKRVAGDLPDLRKDRHSLDCI